ncbi:hypothetical protein L6255_03695 [Candidatus Parcubacteria bacterium]|nr:hypothetical protein [Candidatus Parcubacteria bacterium]
MEEKEIKNTIFIVTTHILFRDIYKPNEPVEGPYTSVINALRDKAKLVEVLGFPLIGYKHPIIYGKESSTKILKLPNFLGVIPPIKYLVDIVLTIVLLTQTLIKNRKESIIVVGIDPLSSIPALILKPIFRFKFIFYCVDFNENRFKNGLMQGIYQYFDRLSSIKADQVWVVCDSLKEYKKKHFGADSIYIPNSPLHDPALSKEGKNKRTGNKLAWTGTLLTERQFGIFFDVVENILKVRPDLEVYLVPIKDHEKFETIIKERKLNNVKVIRLTSRRAWQEFVATCDVGLAVYDDKFGSTKYIEPLKIWDFMLCGVPFIISCEPSIAKPVVDSKVCYLLGPANSFPNEMGLKKFLEKGNLDTLFEKCLTLSRDFAIDKRIISSLKSL